MAPRYKSVLICYVLLLVLMTFSHCEEEPKAQFSPIDQNREDHEVSVFLPIFDFIRPFKFTKSPSRKTTFKSLLDTSKITNLNLIDSYVVTEDSADAQSAQARQKSQIIKETIVKEIGSEESTQHLKDRSGRYFAFPNKEYFRTRIQSTEISKLKLEDYSESPQELKFSPYQPLEISKPICIPTVQLITLMSITQDIYLTSISTDLYQVNIFPITKKEAGSLEKKDVYPKLIQQDKPIVFQLITLPDVIGTVSGTIFMKLSDGSTYLYPVIINGYENIYRVMPIYVINWATSKELVVPISIVNPHESVLIVRDIVKSFRSINLLWPNGVQVDDGPATTDMMEIPAKSEKFFLVISFYKEVANVEYALLQIKTNKDTLIIPVLIKVEVKGIVVAPSIFGFGMIDVGKVKSNQISSVKRVIVVKVSNPTKQDIQIQSINLNLEEHMIEFELNFDNEYCSPLKIKNQTSPPPQAFYFDYKRLGVTSKSSFSTLCTIPKESQQTAIGFIILNPRNYFNHMQKIKLNKVVTGNVVFQTDFNDNPIIYVPYEYYLDREIFSVIQPKLSDIDSNSGFFYVDLRASASTEKLETTLEFTKNSDKYKINGLEDNHASNNLFYELNGAKKTESKEIIYKYDVNIKNPHSLADSHQRISFVKFQTSLGMIAMIPVHHITENLHLVSCKSNRSFDSCIRSPKKDIFKSLNYSHNGHYDYRIYDDDIVSSDSNSRYLFLVNNSIKDIEFSTHFIPKSEEVGFIYEGQEPLESDPSTEAKVTANDIQFKDSRVTESIRGNPSKLKIMSNSYIVFSIYIYSSFSKDVSATVKFYNNYSGAPLTIHVKNKVVKGSFNITPTIIRFEPAFPGLFQTKVISSKSSFTKDVTIQEIFSSDSRMVVSLLSDNINTNMRTEIIKIQFDPSQVPLEENFMRGSLNEISNVKYLSYKELFLWKQNQQLWEYLGSTGQTDINANLSIVTNIKTENLQLRGILSKPALVQKDEIDFGLAQIGDQIQKYIEVNNPSDEIIKVKLILAPDNYRDINDYSMLNNPASNSSGSTTNINPNSNIDIFDCHIYNSTLTPVLSADLASKFYTNSKSTKSSNYGKGTQPQSRGKTNINSSKDSFYSNANSKFHTKQIIVDRDQPNINYDLLPKIELIDKLYQNADAITRNFIMNSDKIICNLNSLSKNEIIINENAKLTDKVFSKEFNQEINEIREINKNAYDKRRERDYSMPDNLSVWGKFLFYLKLVFIGDESEDEKGVDNNQHELRHTDKNQDFYIPKLISDEVYYIRPHQKIKLGPIIFSPSDFTYSSATLFIKNNLTILYPIQLKGNGGSGVIEFYSLDEDIHGDIIEEKIYDRMIVDIDDMDKLPNYNENKGLIKKIMIKNTGNLMLKIYQITIDSQECESYGIKILDCVPSSKDSTLDQKEKNTKNFAMLRDGESKIIEILLKPDFNFYYLEKQLFFKTNQRNIAMQICINISNEYLAEKNSIINFKNIFNTGNLISFIVISIIIFIVISTLVKESEESSQASKPKLEFMDYNEIVRKNPNLLYESLYIKAYRRQNEDFHEKFFSIQMDKPGTYDPNIEAGITHKRKTQNKRGNTIYSSINKAGAQNDESVKAADLSSEAKSSIQAKPPQEKLAERKSESKLGEKVIKLEKKEDKPIEKDKEREKEKTASSYKKEKISNANARNKDTDKKDKKGSINNPSTLISQNSAPINSNHPGPASIEDATKKQHIKNKGSSNNQLGNSQKAQPISQATTSTKKSQAEPQNETLPAYTTYSKESLYSIYENPNLNPVQSQPHNNVIGGSTSNPTYNQDDLRTEDLLKVMNSSKPFIPKNKQLLKNKPDNDKSESDIVASQILKEDNQHKKTKSDNSGNNRDLNEGNEILDSIKNLVYNYLDEDPKDKRDIKDSDKKDAQGSKQKNNNEDKHSVNSNKYFNKFNEDIITDNDTNALIIDNTKNDEYDKQSGKQIQEASFSEKENNKSDNLKEDIKNKFAAFNKPAFMSIKQDKAEANEENNSEEENSLNYMSDMNKDPFASGAEDFSRNFMFSAIFGGSNNNNLKMPSYTLENEMDSEDKNDLYKSFRDFNSGSIYPGFGAFSLNPFSNDNEAKQSDLLGGLRDDSDDETKNKLNDDKLDDVIEDDDEEDPDWAYEDMTVKKDGFFDETGTFKLKQTDFSFDMDKNAIKKLRK